MLVPPSPCLAHRQLCRLLVAAFCLLAAAAALETGFGDVEEGGSAAGKQGNTSKVEDASYFHIYYGHSFKIIRNGADGVNYLLIQNYSRMAGKMKYCTSRIKSFVTPISNYSIHTDYFPVSFFELLGLLGKLKGITSASVLSPCLLKSIQEGQVTLINDTDPQQLAPFSAHFLNYPSQALTCNTATFLPLAEGTPLQQAEWIKYVGMFANDEVRSNQVYDAVKQNYLCLANATKSQETSFKPIVAWIEYYNNTWSFATDAYKFKYVEDAGGENLGNLTVKNSYNISNPEDLDEFHAILCTVDVVIDETYTPNPADYTKSTFLQNINVEDYSFLAFMTNESLWRTDKRIQNSTALVSDWDDGAISQPQLVLADLAEALFPTGNYSTTYLRNLAKEEGIINIGPEMCTGDASFLMEPMMVACG